MTRHRFGRGVSFYIGTRLAAEGLAWVLAEACREAGVAPVLETPPGVEAVARTRGGARYLALFNHSDETVTVALPERFTALGSGALQEGTLELAARDAVFLRARSATHAQEPAERERSPV